MNEITVEAKAENLEKVQDFAAQYLAEYPKKIQKQICVVIDEILSNIIKNAYPSATGLVTFRIAVDDGIMMEFEDSGAAFDPLSQADPDITLSVDERQVGGLGIFIVKKFMDSVKYRREGNKNILSVFKDIEI